jgi:hypothetical protein
MVRRYHRRLPARSGLSMGTLSMSAFAALGEPRTDYVDPGF